MMNVIRDPNKEQLESILERPLPDYSSIMSNVQAILHNVKQDGDKALTRYSLEFDKVETPGIKLAPGAWDAGDRIEQRLKTAIGVCAKNIRTFHSSQRLASQVVQPAMGISCWRKQVAIEKVGLYIPGGSAPLFSTLLMLAIPAQLAGCRDIIVCTPPNQHGTIDPAIIYTAKYLGLQHLYIAGGAQAIGAMAYGTETIPRVNKIFGPGNSYVTCAKNLISAEGIAIDLPAGPTELAILADDTCKPAYVAADILAQAEHGPDSQILFVCTSEQIINKVLKNIEEQITSLPRKDIIRKALLNSTAILVPGINEGLKIINEYAPEHLLIICEEQEKVAGLVINAGSVFIGNFTPPSAGDYATGTNHTLPTNRHAKAYSGVSIDSFVKVITFQKMSHYGIDELSTFIAAMARGEGLESHALSAEIRKK